MSADKIENEKISMKADLTHEEVKNLIAAHYNLNTTKIKDLDSFEDKNFFFKASGDNVHPHGYVLKVLNSVDSENQAFVDGVSAALRFVSKRVIKTQDIVQDVNGADTFVQKFRVFKEYSNKKTSTKGNLPDEHEFVVRVFTFVPGIVLHEVKLTQEIIVSMGELTGKMAVALSDFVNEGIASRDCVFSMTHTPRLRKKMCSIKEENDKKMVNFYIDKFEEDVLTQIHKLDSKIIHADLHTLNILASEKENGGRYEISALLDFGDIQKSYNVYDVAISIAHAMLDVKDMDVIDVGGYHLSGYFKHAKLTELEFKLLPVCVAARLVQATVVCLFTYEEDPSNDYVLRLVGSSLKTVRAMWKLDFDAIRNRWMQVLIQQGYENMQDYII